MYLQSIKSVKHNAAKSVNRSVLKNSRHIGFGSSMLVSDYFEGKLAENDQKTLIINMSTNLSLQPSTGTDIMGTQKIEHSM
jgi:hypothetical protein